MFISSFGFKGFRNLEENRLNTSSRAIVFSGINASGKTSLLECIYTSMLLSSFRTKKLEEIVAFKSPQARVLLELKDGDAKHIVDATIERGSKKILLDDKPIQKRSELISLFAIVAFSYNDKEIVTHEPKGRRHFFDQILSFTQPEYYTNLKNYKTIIKERNQAIRTSHMNLVSFYDTKLSELGFFIYKKRLEVVQKVEKMLNKISLELFPASPQDYSITYKSPCQKLESPDDYYDALKSSLDADIATFSTSFGVHIDDFIFQKDGKNATMTLSTGQIRLLSILLRLAEVEIVCASKSQAPVVLVDDVLLELDDARRDAIFLYLHTHYPQVFWTFIEGVDFYKKFDDVKIYNVSMGKVVEK